MLRIRLKLICLNLIMDFFSRMEPKENKDRLDLNLNNNGINLQFILIIRGQLFVYGRFIFFLGGNTDVTMYN